MGNMRKISAGLAVTAALCAGCGSSSHHASVADRCATLRTHAITWAQNYEAPLGGTQAQVVTIAQSALAYNAASHGLRCYF